MSFLVLRAYWELIAFDCYIARGSYSDLYNRVRSHRIAKRAAQADAVTRVCAATNMACVWYWKEALCLQRSAATTCLLRSSGIPAQLVVGAQQDPPKAHAWVEVNGQVVNDRPYIPEIYAVLDRY